MDSRVKGSSSLNSYQTDSWLFFRVVWEDTSPTVHSTYS
jgi:hypothetical protein